MKELIWIRNYVIAPISEEFTFRACMLAMIIHCTNPTVAVFVCPIFFGAAHLHHMIEQMRFGVKWKVALATSCKFWDIIRIFGLQLLLIVSTFSYSRFPVHVHVYFWSIFCVFIPENRSDSLTISWIIHTNV